jgi:peptidoglycan hydrolase-like protein with peptidoglycan-binding domain
VSRLKKTAALAAMLLAPTAVVVATPTAALAAAQCTKSVSYQGTWVPASAGGSINCQMGRGAESSAVLQLQHTINTCYPKSVRGDALDTDGNFGPNTQTALTKVQRHIGADDDGVYGPETQSKMKFIHTEAFPLRCL